MFKRIYISIIIISFAGMVSSCRNPFVDPPGEENQAPYPVTADFTAKSFHQGTVDNTFQMLIAEQGGLKDPDGDAVFFRSSILPVWITLNEDSGVVTVDTAETHDLVTISFWSEDASGSETSNVAYNVDVDVNNDTPYPVTASVSTYVFNQGSISNTFQLEIDQQDGLSDPNGDIVYFRSDIPSGHWLTLNEISGLVTADTTDPHSSESFLFWSEDVGGLNTNGSAVTVSFEVNQAPVASFGTWDYVVSNAEDSNFNQNYSYVDSINVKPHYSGGTSSEFHIYAAEIYSFYHWIIDINDDAFSPTAYSDVAYYIFSSSSTPPLSGWSIGATESASNLTLTEYPIHGDTSAIGNTLSAMYQYSDPDGDSEASSTFIWYRCANPDDPGTAIPDSNSLSYTTTISDNLMYLRFEVTPIDEHGFSGIPQKSDASRRIGISS
ncbi:MAG: hypothetical protein JEY91_17640 [Spirochaetaceae bacterium]|nr:hypothetical protein [Spirochaetaceae bacterium]